VKFIADRRRATLTYEDYWRLTLVSYHSGYQCVAQALDYTIYNQLPTDWIYISRYSCPGTNAYINNIWNALENFDAARIKRPDSPRPVYVPTFEATRTPVPTPTITPTPVIERSLGSVRVLVYVDANNNFYPDPNERVDDVLVLARLPDGQEYTARTMNGEVLIDLTGQPIGRDVVISLPELFRTQRVRTLRDGEIPVVFRLEQPVVPPVLP
jgi:hypothetical protein